uniref:Uncharacterized protein n=1 Tax=Arundo donax TaxID=35708 RepID=A0A0A9TSR6_ARUDO
MADKPSDACSRTDGDGARPSRNNKRKSSRVCSYPDKKNGFIVSKERERYVIGVFAAVVFMLIDLFTEEEEEEEEWELWEKGREEEEEEKEEEEGDEEDGEEQGEEEEEKEEEEEEEEEEDEEEEEEEEQSDEVESKEEGDDLRADLLGGPVDIFRATQAWAKRELGPENANYKGILGMLRLIPGFDEELKAVQKAAKAKRRLEFL